MGAIVVGYVPKPEGEAALRLAAEEARRRSSSLVVVNSHRGPVEREAEDVTDWQSHLEQVSRQLKEAGVDHDVRQLAPGIDPAEDLMNVAAEVAADLIVIGLRRRTPVGKLILGSSAQRILLDAPCPVLAVKAAG